LSSTATVQNWTPLCRRTREVCDFLNTSSENAHKHTKTCKSSVSTYNQPNLESTQNQPRFLRLKFWAQDGGDGILVVLGNTDHVFAVAFKVVGSVDKARLGRAADHVLFVNSNQHRSRRHMESTSTTIAHCMQLFT
jgi:hypothetical protein